MRIEPYLARIGFEGTPRPDLETLARLQFRHVVAIPFENLSPLLGEPVSLDADAIEDKLVHRRRGGWCFEHNLLFTHVLREIGFEVLTLAARVRWNVPPNVTSPRSHCLLLVTIDGERFIADVGFGGLTLTAPLRLAPGAQATPHEPHRLVEEAGGCALEALVAGEWQRLYVFDLHEQLQADCEVSNWYLAHHPGSPFVQGLICARADTDVRHALRDTRYTLHHRDGRSERRFVTEVEALKRLLAQDMKIPLPEGRALDEALARVIAAHPPG